MSLLIRRVRLYGEGDRLDVLISDAQIAEIGPEGGDRLREIGEHVGELTFNRALVDVMVPSADVGERDLHAEICFDQLRELPQSVGKAAFGIVGARSGRVFSRIGGLQHFYSVECFCARTV